MRDLVVVLDAMIEKIPQEEEGLINKLKSVQSSASFAPPENMFIWWQESASCINSRFSRFKEEPTEEWAKEMLDIWMDRVSVES